MPKRTTQNYTGFKWTKPKLDAAALVAADELTNDEIAASVGVVRKTLWEWCQNAEFAARVGEIARELGDVARRYAIANRGRRLQGYDDRRGRILDLIAARAAAHAAATGGETGLLARTEKSLGSGPAAQIVGEYAVDAALLKELRELEKQAAIEAGQWSEKREHSGPGGGPVRVAHEDLSKLTADELVRRYLDKMQAPGEGGGRPGGAGP